MNSLQHQGDLSIGSRRNGGHPRFQPAINNNLSIIAQQLRNGRCPPLGDSFVQLIAEHTQNEEPLPQRVDRILDQQKDELPYVPEKPCRVRARADRRIGNASNRPYPRSPLRRRYPGSNSGSNSTRRAASGQESVSGFSIKPSIRREQRG